MKEQLLKEFSNVYGEEGDIEVYFAPGRVNMIGEHTDYNGGHVFPCALTIGTYVVIRKRSDQYMRFYSMNFEKLGVIESSIDKIEVKIEDNWANYPKGVVWTLLEKGYEIGSGFDMLVYGNIPNGSGLSSSASLEVVTSYALNIMFDLKIELVDLALLSQYAENHFIGVNCGIMDQFAVTMGKNDHAIFLDTSNLKYEYAPLVLEDAKIIIACSNKKRGLADSKYNERRSQCEAALKDLQQELNIKALGELNMEQFEKYSYLILDETCKKRAKHAVAENQRTIQAVNFLKANNINEFGRLMNESHISLRDDYEVTGIELDTLAQTAWEQKGVIGSRMTGAGFGGCTVSIVQNDNIDDFINNVGNKYMEQVGYAADFYVVEIGTGVCSL